MDIHLISQAVLSIETRSEVDILFEPDKKKRINELNLLGIRRQA